MIDEKGRLFGKISIIDICILLVVLIAVGGFAFKITRGSEILKVGADTPITMVLEIKGVRQFAVDAIDIGDEIYERNGPELGRVVGVRSEGYKDTLDLNDGTQVYTDVEGLYTLYITVEGTGRADEEGHFINGTRFVAVGSQIKIKSEKIMSNASIYEVVGR
jgi:hypothetical protein